tara:strand:+ start:2955 stop:3413 length:459 start_codon:yes stop_codon:yes gene_type:complete
VRERVLVTGNLDMFSNSNFADVCTCDLLTRRVGTFQQLLTDQRRKLANGCWCYLRGTALDLLTQDLVCFVEAFDFHTSLLDAASNVRVTCGQTDRMRKSRLLRGVVEDRRPPPSFSTPMRARTLARARSGAEDPQLLTGKKLPAKITPPRVP